jgi:hypothetical protein
MSVLFQIALGSAFLVACLWLHILVMIALTRRMRGYVTTLNDLSVRHAFAILAAVVVVFLLSHTVQLYLWAFALWGLGALPGHEEPIYFALVTYTTVGYGDVTVGPAFRIFGAMASVNGILAFGLTTAFLVALLPRLLAVLRD